MLNNNITAVILAAGQGTRMKSSQPKVLHEILGRPMIAYLLDTLREAGVNDIVVVVGHQAEAVKEALKDYGVRFVIQEPQLGTGHAVQVAMPAVPPEAGTVMVLCGDAPLISGESIAALQQLHASTGAAVTVQTIELPDGAHYGRVVRDESGRVAAVVQAKDSHDRPDLLAIREINTGAYCFDAAFLVDGLMKIPKSPVTGEIYLTDLIHIARQQGRGVEALVDPDWEALLGINSRAELAGATQHRQAPDQRPAHGPGGHPHRPGGHLYRVFRQHRQRHRHLSQRLSPGQNRHRRELPHRGRRSRLSILSWKTTFMSRWAASSPRAGSGPGWISAPVPISGP